MKLYKIKNDILDHLDSMLELEPESFEYKEKLVDLGKLEEDFDAKVRNVGAYYKNIKSDIEAMKEYEKSMRAKRTAAENHIKRLKEYLKFNMEEAGITKINSLEFNISIRKTPERVVIDNPFEIPKEYISSTDVHFDKKAIKSAIQGGDMLPGVHLENGNTIIIK
jgi:hypothetical protein